jgi:hypothetical protein
MWWRIALLFILKNAILLKRNRCWRRRLTPWRIGLRI